MISAVSTSKGCNQACIWKDLLRDELCFSFIQLETQTIFDQCHGTELRAAFQFLAFFLSLLFFLNFEKLSRMKAVYTCNIWIIFVRANLENKNKSVW
jgi:hypothetical protein